MPRWTADQVEQYRQREGQPKKRQAPSMRKAVIPSEHSIQAAFIRWTTIAVKEYPELANLFAVPNGGLRPFAVDRKGNRYSPIARKMKAEGVKEGVPDLLLLAARGEYHGLAIEVKRPGGRLSASQAEWHMRLIQEGYLVKVCYSVDEMIAITKQYLRG